MNIEDAGAFDLNLLVVFDALLTDGNVTRAARRVGLSQPAFSNALRRLRARIGDPLFERRGGGMRPTLRALAMARPVRLGLAEFRRALSGSGLPEGTRTVTIAANSYARCILPGVRISRASIVHSRTSLSAGKVAPSPLISWAVPWIVAQTDLVGTVPRRLARVFTRMLKLRVFKPPLSLLDAVLAISCHGHGERDPVVMSVREHVLEAGRHLGGRSHA